MKLGTEFRVKVAAAVGPLPPAKASGFPYPAAELEGLTIIPYAGRHGRVAYSFRARGLRALTVSRVAKAGDCGETVSTSAAA